MHFHCQNNFLKCHYFLTLLSNRISFNFPIMGFFNYRLRKRYCLKLQAAMNCNQNISTLHVLHWRFLLVCLRWKPLRFINVTSSSSIIRCPIHVCLFSPDVPFISTVLCCFIHDALGCIFSLNVLLCHLFYMGVHAEVSMFVPYFPTRTITSFFFVSLASCCLRSHLCPFFFSLNGQVPFTILNGPCLVDLFTYLSFSFTNN